MAGLKSKRLSRAYSTAPTLKIFESYASSLPPGKAKTVRIGERFKIGSFLVEAFNSGHIFGSAGFLVEIGGVTIAYTGDLNLAGGLLTEPAEPVGCDILILEATYGSPRFTFPSRTSIYNRMVRWAVEQAKDGYIPAFHVYPVGKAQEVTRLLNEFTELEVYVHPKIAAINEAHRGFGVKLEAEPLKGHIRPGRCALILPRSMLGRYPSSRIRPAVATGWAVCHRWAGAEAFPLSNHADYHQLLTYVLACKPRLVYTCYGFDETLASSVRRRLGIEAYPIPTGSAKMIKEL